ncbi:MAG: response regulator [Candidatus Methanoperedens sp.]|nr:response regulator [Candidatus Methanoperedens sp.]
MTKILVVEDDPLSMELTQEMLNSMGFTVHGAMDGKEAIKKVEKEYYDLILMDIGLPDVNGIEVTKIIKSIPRYKNVPVIALTVYAMKGEKEKILKSGLDDHISKPINVFDFKKKIISWVGASGLEEKS